MSGNKHSGRKPKPTAELEALGSWRAKERTDEPARIDCDVECPEWLEGDAREYWDWHYPMLRANGTLSAPDCAAFAMLCQRWADWKEARDKCETEGRDIELLDRDGKGTGNWKRAPWDMRERDLYNQYVQLSREYGLTPVSRTGVHALEHSEGEQEDCIT